MTRVGHTDCWSLGTVLEIRKEVRVRGQAVGMREAAALAVGL